MTPPLKLSPNCRERRARPSLTRVAGHAQRSGQDGASGGGIRSRGERRGARPDSCRPACERFAGDREAGFRLARRTLRLAFGAANRARSVARGKRAPEGGAVAPPLGGLGAPKQDRAGNGSAHPLRSTHPPTRVREWVSYEADTGEEDYRQECRAVIVLDGCTGGRVGSGVGAVPRVAESGRWGLWVAARSAAAHSRDLVCCVNRVEVIPS